MRSKYRSNRNKKKIRKKLNIGLLTLVVVMSVITIVTYVKYHQEKGRYNSLLKIYRNLKEEVESQRRINEWIKEVIERNEKIRGDNVTQAKERANTESEKIGGRSESEIHTEEKIEGIR